ncbi:putative RNA-directed DNA polymerase [Tanacetum coccineum]
MIEPFLITNNLMGYVDDSIPCPTKTLPVTEGVTIPKENLNYSIWVSNDAHVRVCTREYTLKTQLLRIEMHGDETPDAYLNRAQEYSDALAIIGEPVKDKDLVMLDVLGLREEYNGLKTTITARQSPTAFSELHALLSDHDYMLGKTCAPAPSITLSFAANYAVGSPSMTEPRQAQLSELAAQLSALGFQVSPIIPSGPQAFYGARSNNNNNNRSNNNNRGNFNNSRGNNNQGRDNGTNSYVTPDLAAMDTSEAYYGDDAFHVGNGKSSNGQPSPVSTTSIPTPPPPRQLDIQNAFLHGNLKEQVYMKQPFGFIDPQRPNHVCLLHKSLYGLKQSPRAWFERLSKALFDLGFKGFKTDPSLFIYSRGDTLFYILVYVDDIIVTGNNKGTIDNIKCQLGSDFALKDLRPLNYFLGIEIVPHVSGILLSQKKYILKLLQSAGLSNCNLVSSPMVTSSSLSIDDSTAFSNPVKYRQVVGSLQYVTLSRPDIAFVVNKVCQYMHAPTENHWSAVKRILRYLHGTVEHGMLIRRSSGSTLQAFTDVLWKGGFAIYLGSNLISWTARKQRTVSRSSIEAEYKAIADTVAELTWLQALLNELGIRSSSTPILWWDDLGATYLSAKPIFHARIKHVEIDYHFVWEKVAQGDLRVQHISTHDQITDIFTKPLPTPRFLFLRSKLQVVARL